MVTISMKRFFFRAFTRLAALAVAAFAHAVSAADQPPNVVLIFPDDLGYGDLSCYGAKSYRTPHLDRLAAEGVRFTDFYVSSPVCSASRAALLTGCYHERVGIRGALGPKDKRGLNPHELTIAKMLKARGYATGMAGKWHLGSATPLLPNNHGFDDFLGLPYSADMWPRHPENPKGYPPLPLIENGRVVDPDVTAEVQAGLTKRFAQRAVEFIKAHKDEPFFFYFAPNQPHVPLFVSAEHAGKSGAGLYGDVIQELDACVGQIVATIEECGVRDRTLILFCSDNGPWLSYGPHAGSSGGLREGKGTCYEGGIRVPFIASWLGKIAGGRQCGIPCATIDLLPTLAGFCGAPMPPSSIDGKNIGPILMNKSEEDPHEALFFYYGDDELQAMRAGKWKLLFPHTARTMNGQSPGHDGVPGKYRPLAVGLELYDLDEDRAETRNLVDSQPAVVRELQSKAAAMRLELGDKLQRVRGNAARAPATLE
jgi:arylsulfatase A-like enzyme